MTASVDAFSTLLPKLEESIRRIVREELEAVHVGCPGVILAYDPVQRRAEVQPHSPLVYLDHETGERAEIAMPPIANVPVHFGGGGGFESVHHVEAGDPCWVKFSHSSLEDWLSNGQAGAADESPRFSPSDAVAEVGLHHFGSPGEPVAAGVWRIGAKDGPQIIFDRNRIAIDLRALNQITIAAGAQVRIDSDGDVYIQGRWVDPLGGDI